MSRLGEILSQSEKRFSKNEKVLLESMKLQDGTPKKSKKLMFVLICFLLFFFLSGLFLIISINAKLRGIKTTAKTYYSQDFTEKKSNNLELEVNPPPGNITSDSYEKNTPHTKVEESPNKAEIKNPDETPRSTSKIEKKKGKDYP